MDKPQRKELAHQSWKIEEFHRVIKKFMELNDVEQQKVSHIGLIYNSQLGLF